MAVGVGGPPPPEGTFGTPADHAMVFRGEGTSLLALLRSVALGKSDTCIQFAVARLGMRGLGNVRQLLLAERAAVESVFADRLINNLA